jgi:hypothetical protein
VPDAVFHFGVVVDLLFLAFSVGILVWGVWIAKDPTGFWNQFNPFLKPYSSLTLCLGRVIGSLWALGAASACLLFLGNAIQAGLHHQWLW